MFLVKLNIFYLCIDLEKYTNILTFARVSKNIFN